MGIAFLGGMVLLPQLFWLQRLCEWSGEICPHVYQSPPYTASEQSAALMERPVPIGLSQRIDRQDRMVMLKTNRNPLNDSHLDGDVLVRLLQKGGAETLTRLIRETAARDDRVGEWTKRHLHEEVEVVDEVVATLEKLLDCWL